MQNQVHAVGVLISISAHDLGDPIYYWEIENNV